MPKGSSASVAPTRSAAGEADAEGRQTDSWGVFVNPKDEEAFLQLRLEQVGKQTGGNLVIAGVVWMLLYGLGSEKAAAELSHAWLFWLLRIGCGTTFLVAGLALRWRMAWADAQMMRRGIVPACTIAWFALGYFFLLFQDQLVDKNLRPANNNATDSTLLRFAVFRTHATSYKLAAEMGIVGCLVFVHACRGLVEGRRIAALGTLTVAFQLVVTVLSRVKLQRQGYTVETESIAPYVQQTGLCAFAVYLIVSKELRSMHRRRQMYADHLQNLTLTRDKAATEASQRAHSRFVAMFSHELRTPLTSVIGNLELLCRDPRLADGGDGGGAPIGSAKQAGNKHGARALSSSRLLLSLVNNILDLSRLQAGALVLQRRRFNVHEMLRTVEDVVRTAAEAKDIAVAFRADEAVPAVLCGDPTRIQQIILNLTANACKFTRPRGNISVHVTVARGVTNTFGMGRERKEEVALRVRIQDSGIGIPRSEVKRIWQMFYKLSSSEQTSGGGNVPADSSAGKGVDTSSGTGCGLAICKQLAELMGGGVAVTSELGRGSTFTVTAVLELPTKEELALPLPLPLQSQPAAAQPVPTISYTRTLEEDATTLEAIAAASVDTKPKPPTPGRRRRVLLAEDNSFNAEVLAEMLKHTCHVTCTADGTQAMDAFTAAAGSGKPFDLVLMDCHMPHKDGFTATREIRHFERERGMRVTPVVALTAHGDGDSHVREKCNAAGMSSYISKPVQCDVLVERVNHEIDVPTVAGCYVERVIHDIDAPTAAAPGASATGDEAKAEAKAGIGVTTAAAPGTCVTGGEAKAEAKARHDAEIAALIALELGGGGAATKSTE